MTWKDKFRSVLVEVDPMKLLALIHEAENAMMARSQSLTKVSDEERLALGDATYTLGILKKHARAESV